MEEKQPFQRFKPHEIAKTFPDSADTLLLDTYLTDEEAASARVFRSIAARRRTTTPTATSISTCSQAAAPSG